KAVVLHVPHPVLAAAAGRALPNVDSRHPRLRGYPAWEASDERAESEGRHRDDCTSKLLHGYSIQAEAERRRQGAKCDVARFSVPRVSYSSIRLVRLSTASLRPRKQPRQQAATDSRRRSKH